VIDQALKPSLAKMLTTMHRIYSQHMTTLIAPYGINLTDLAIIMSLYASPGRSLNTIAKYKKINKAILSKSLKKLENDDLVTLKNDPNHKQRFNIYITPKAKKLVPKLRKMLDEYEASILSDLTQTNKNIFLKTFQNLYKKEVDQD
jgi:DNA-binding MarR family transcriptional regulator